MDDIQLIVQTLTDTLLHRLGDEVDLIFQYGSQLSGATHRYSDVDISYTPVHETTCESITVMVGDTLCDLYPIQATRTLLLDGQRQFLRVASSFPQEFDAAYPELKRDLLGVMLACEQQDKLAMKTSLLSLLHEMSRGIVQASSGVVYSNFNSLAEYEQDLAALGFPALLPYATAGKFATLHRQCQRFDDHLRAFLTNHGVQLNTFDTPAALQEHLLAQDESNP